MIEREWISKEEAKETLPDVPNLLMRYINLLFIKAQLLWLAR